MPRATFPIMLLNRWLSARNKSKLVIRDSLSVGHLSDLFITLPTRDGSSRPYLAPTPGTPLPYGHHLAFFHPRNPEHVLRKDGTDPDFCPPEPFTRRMWASGQMRWNHTCPLLLGTDATAVFTVSQVDKKNFDSPSPMLFVKQSINYSHSDVAVQEERSHVYFSHSNAGQNKRVIRKGTPGLLSYSANNGHLVQDLPVSQFSFTYTPTVTTLFRFSALTWNGHHIHIDKDYVQQVEGYPGMYGNFVFLIGILIAFQERLVHGPLSALMLLETFTYHYPDAQLSLFDYRAINPLTVNNKVTIHGAWVNGKMIKVWLVKEVDGVVCMTGNIHIL